MKPNTLSLSMQLARAAPKPKPPARQWVIWRRGGLRPKVRHTSLQAALDEVVRLHKLAPDERYDIFELVPLQRNTGLRR
jgi:hypothetical protein